MFIYVINSLTSIIQTRVFTARYRLSLEARVRSLVSPCEISGGQSGNVTRFSQGTLVFPCQNGLPHCPTLIFIYMLLLPDGWLGEGWEPSKKESSFANRVALDRKFILLSLKRG